jgi:hypothetical protein
LHLHLIDLQQFPELRSKKKNENFLQVTKKKLDIFAIFQHMMFKFKILKEDSLRTNIAIGFFNPLSKSPGIGLEL